MLALPATAAIAEDDVEEFGEAADEYEDADVNVDVDVNVNDEDEQEVALVVLVEAAVVAADEGAHEEVKEEEELYVTEDVVTVLVDVTKVEVVVQEEMEDR